MQEFQLSKLSVRSFYNQIFLTSSSTKRLDLVSKGLSFKSFVIFCSMEIPTRIFKRLCHVILIWICMTLVFTFFIKIFSSVRFFQIKGKDCKPDIAFSFWLSFYLKRIILFYPPFTQVSEKREKYLAACKHDKEFKKEMTIFLGGGYFCLTFK